MKEEPKVEKEKYLYCIKTCYEFFTKGHKYLILKDTTLGGIRRVTLKDDYGLNHGVTNNKVIGWLKNFRKSTPKVKESDKLIREYKKYLREAGYKVIKIK